METSNMIGPTAAPAAPSVALAATLAPILIAEDDDELRRVIGYTLREEGYPVIEASNGFELLDCIEAAISRGGRSNPPISLIISDVRMPGLTGIDILSILRCAYWATPVVLMSAFADLTVRVEAAELGAAAVIAKPFDLDELKTVVRSAVRRAEVLGTRSPSRRRSS